tara:strand:- start:37 stop:405 length:369 start_codon:yes stop_codon:yes gene_type:complete
MIEYYYLLMTFCCFIWIYLNADTISQQWHAGQRGLGFWINIFLTLHAGLLASMLLIESVHNVLFVYADFIIVVSNLFALYTVRKVLRRWQLKKCGKDFHKTQCNLQAVAFSKGGMLSKIFNS